MKKLPQETVHFDHFKAIRSVTNTTSETHYFDAAFDDSPQADEGAGKKLVKNKMRKHV